MSKTAAEKSNNDARRPWVLVLLAALIVIAAASAPVQASPAWPQIAVSQDGTPISYEVHGKGEPTLVFVHGWSCDARYWRMQVPYFSGRHRLVVMDLAGHGHSGWARTRYTMAAFGADVQAVVEATGSARVILIGHSMGGAVIAEAAIRMPARVIGVIGVDTLDDIEYPLTREAFEQMMAPFKTDFASAAKAFVGEMFRPDTDPGLRDWVLADIAAAPPAVAMSAMTEMMGQYITGDAARIFEGINAPVMVVNGDLWPVNMAGNRRHMHDFTATIIKDADHFLMMDRPEAFNRALEKAIQQVLQRMRQ